MTDHKTGSRQEWLAARLELLAAEKELTRRGDELARVRQELPWVRLDKEYALDTDEGTASLAGLFRGRSQLLVYHFMFGPAYTAGCPACSAIADGFNGFVTHLAHHDVMLWAVSRAPLAKLQAYKQRMGWSFPWASSYGSDFNADFQAGCSQEQEQSGVGEYNFRTFDLKAAAQAGSQPALAEWAATTGTSVAALAGSSFSARTTAAMIDVQARLMTPSAASISISPMLEPTQQRPNPNPERMFSRQRWRKRRLSGVSS